MQASNQKGISSSYSGIAATDGAQAQEVAFVYVPGAGDDEESWAKGLTPEIFWQNKEVRFIAAPVLTLSAGTSFLASPLYCFKWLCEAGSWQKDDQLSPELASDD